MKPAVGSDVQRRPQQPTERPNTEIPSRSVFGFPVSENQFQTLQDSTLAVSQSLVQNEDKLVDPRTTRLSRQQAARRFEDQETLGIFVNEGNFHTVPLANDEQVILHSGGIDPPVTSRIRHSFFPHSYLSLH